MQADVVPRLGDRDHLQTGSLRIERRLLLSDRTALATIQRDIAEQEVLLSNHQLDWHRDQPRVRHDHVQQAVKLGERERLLRLLIQRDHLDISGRGIVEELGAKAVRDLPKRWRLDRQIPRIDGPRPICASCRMPVMP